MYCTFVDERGVNTDPRPPASPLWTGKSSRNLGRTEPKPWGTPNRDCGLGSRRGVQPTASRSPPTLPVDAASSGINTQAPPNAIFALRRASALRPLPRVRLSGIESREAPVAQLDRALPSERRGHRFESFRARHFGTKLRAPRVADSTLPAATRAPKRSVLEPTHSDIAAAARRVAL